MEKDLEQKVNDIDKRLYALEQLTQERSEAFKKVDEDQWKEINFTAKDARDKLTILTERYDKKLIEFRANIIKIVSLGFTLVGLLIGLLRLLK